MLNKRIVRLKARFEAAKTLLEKKSGTERDAAVKYLNSISTTVESLVSKYTSFIPDPTIASKINFDDPLNTLRALKSEVEAILAQQENISPSELLNNRGTFPFFTPFCGYVCF